MGGEQKEVLLGGLKVDGEGLVEDNGGVSFLCWYQWMSW